MSEPSKPATITADDPDILDHLQAEMEKRFGAGSVKKAGDRKLTFVLGADEGAPEVPDDIWKRAGKPDA